VRLPSEHAIKGDESKGTYTSLGQPQEVCEKDWNLFQPWQS